MTCTSSACRLDNKNDGSIIQIRAVTNQNTAHPEFALETTHIKDGDIVMLTVPAHGDDLLAIACASGNCAMSSWDNGRSGAHRLHRVRKLGGGVVHRRDKVWFDEFPIGAPQQAMKCDENGCSRTQEESPITSAGYVVRAARTSALRMPARYVAADSDVCRSQGRAEERRLHLPKERRAVPHVQQFGNAPLQA